MKYFLSIPLTSCLLHAFIGTVCVCLVLVCDECRLNGKASLNSDGENIPPKRFEWYCNEHHYLRGNYFTFLNIYDVAELERQRSALAKTLLSITRPSLGNSDATKKKHIQIIEKQIEVKLPNGETKTKTVRQKKINQKLLRKKNTDPFQRELSIKRQIKKIEKRIKHLQDHTDEALATLPLPCRSCKKADCRDGKCWGFWQSPTSGKA